MRRSGFFWQSADSLLSDCLCTSLVALHNIWNSELELCQGGRGLYLPQYVIIIFIYPHKVAEELRSWRTELDKIGDQWLYSWLFTFWKNFCGISLWAGYHICFGLEFQFYGPIDNSILIFALIGKDLVGFTNVVLFNTREGESNIGKI